MGAGTLCLVLSRQGQETLPPWVLTTLGAAMRLQAAGQPLTLRRIGRETGYTGAAAKIAVDRLIAAGLMRRDEKWRSGLAVACVFIPGEGR